MKRPRVLPREAILFVPTDSKVLRVTFVVLSRSWRQMAATRGARSISAILFNLARSNRKSSANFVCRDSIATAMAASAGSCGNCVPRLKSRINSSANLSRVDSVIDPCRIAVRRASTRGLRIKKRRSAFGEEAAPISARKSDPTNASSSCATATSPLRIQQTKCGSEGSGDSRCPRHASRRFQADL